MKNLFYYLLLIFLFLTYNANAQIAEWAESLSSQEIKVTATATDPKYSLSYIAGSFTGERLDFNNGVFLEKPNNIDVLSFIAQYDETGKCLWARAIINANEIRDISVNHSNNDILLCGNFSEDFIDFETGDTFYNVDYMGRRPRRSGFFAIYETNSFFKGANIIHGNPDTLKYGRIFLNSITADKNGNIFLTGEGLGNVHFGNNIEIQFDVNDLYAYDSFVARYNQNNFNCQWVSPIYNTGYASYVRSEKVRTDINGNIYVAGSYYAATVNFPDNISITTGNNRSPYGGFIAKFDNSGGCFWARAIQSGNIGTPDKQYGDKGYVYIRDLSIDSSFSVYVVGNFRYVDTLYLSTNKIHTIDHDSYKDFNALCNHYGSFIARFHNFTAECTWANSILVDTSETDCDDFVIASRLAQDSEGNCYVIGYSWSNTIAFNNDVSLIGLSKQNYNLFLTKIDRFGETQYAHSSLIGPDELTSIPAFDLINDFSISFDHLGAINITGLFKVDNLYFNNGISLDHSENSSRDGFFVRFDTTRYANLPVPSLIAPANNRNKVSKSYKFEWDYIRDANAYIIQLDTDINFENAIEKTIPFDNFTEELDFNPDTYYLWRVKALNTGTRGESEWSSVRGFTSYQAPTLDSISIGRVTTNTARIKGRVISDGGDEIVDRGFCWSLEPFPTIDDFVKYTDGGEGEFELTLHFLEPGTRYYVRAFAKNAAGIGYSQSHLVQREVSFTTNQFDVITLFAAGDNGGGQIGDNTQTNTRKELTPVKEEYNYGWHKIAIGDKHVIAIKKDGTLWGWGANENGELGLGNANSKLVPTQIGTDDDWIQIACGIRWTVALKRDGSLWGAGNNDKSQLGRSSRVSITTLSKVNDIDRWISIAAGREHILAIRDDSTLWAWGYNNNGSNRHLVNIDSFQIVTPKQIAPDSNIKWAKIFAGNTASFAISNEGTLYAWGQNLSGQLGDGTTNNTLVPIIIGNANDKWIKVSNAGSTTIALKRDGSLWSWGSDYGHLGRNSGGHTDPNPGRIGTDSNWIDISRSYNNVVALKDDGTIWGWGVNSYFDLGDPSLANTTYTPTQLGGGNDYWALIADGLPANFRVYGKRENIEMPIVQSRNIDVVGDSATFYGYVFSDGGSEIMHRGICWSGYTNQPTIDGDVIYEDSEGSKTGEYYGNLPKLIPNTHYYVRMFATNAVGTAYGETLEFTSAPSLPIVETVGALNIEETSFDAKGHISNDGGSNITKKGICYATHRNPTTIDNKVENDDDLLTGSFTVTIDNLISGAKYYFKAYATNSRGTGYGELDSVITDHNTQTISLTDGWNMISTYIEPAEKSMPTIWNNIKNSVNLVKDISGKSYIPSFGINQIGDWNKYQGYQAFMSQNETLVINGTEIVPENTPISLNSGWSMIPYLRKSDQNIATSLATLTSDNALNIAKDISGKSYIPQFNINQIGNMQPGQGYQVYLSKNSTLTYPANSSNKELAREVSPMPKYLIPEYSRTGNSAVAILSLNANDGDEIGIFNRCGELIGSGAIKDNLTAVTIWGDNSQTPNIDGAVVNEELSVKYYNSRINKFENIEISNITDYLSGNEISGLNYSNDAVFYLKGNVESKDNNLTLSISPNPIKDNIEISLTTSDCSAINLKIYDLSGRMVQDLSSKLINSNNQILKVNLSNLTNGEYTIVLTCSNLKVSEKLIIMK